MKREVNVVHTSGLCISGKMDALDSSATAPANETPATPTKTTTEGKIIEVSIQNFAF
jgi:hypothetical protein